MVAIGVVARRLHGKEPGRGHRLVAYGSFAGAAVLVARAAAALVWPARIGAPHGLVPSLSMLTAHAITLATSLGFLLMHRERQELDAERLAMTDALTGVYNRRTLFDLGDKELSRARRTGASLSLIILDLDHFKRINDKYGHLGGDAVLLRFVEVVRGCLRQSDVLTRYGGEEFCILLPDVGSAGAKVVGERIRAAVEAAHVLRRRRAAQGDRVGRRRVAAVGHRRGQAVGAGGARRSGALRRQARRAQPRLRAKAA